MRKSSEKPKTVMKKCRIQQTIDPTCTYMIYSQKWSIGSTLKKQLRIMKKIQKNVQNAKNVRHGAKNVSHSGGNLRHGAENMRHCAKNVNHDAKRVCQGAKNVH